MLKQDGAPRSCSRSILDHGAASQAPGASTPATAVSPSGPTSRPTAPASSARDRLARPVPSPSPHRPRQAPGQPLGDTVHGKPVAQVALCSEKKLAAAIGCRLDPTTNCFYQDPARSRRCSRVCLVNGRTGHPTRRHRSAQRAGSRTTSTPVPRARRPAARRHPHSFRLPIFSIQRYLGTLQDISGTVAGQGVSS
jgi:hypothetical protein